jgi:hypothetical protein
MALPMGGSAPNAGRVRSTFSAPMRRRLIQLGLLILAGAIVNVAVAWGCAAWIDVYLAHNQDYAVDVEGAHTHVVIRRFDRGVYWLHLMRGGTGLVKPTSQNTTDALLPDWSGLDNRGLDDEIAQGKWSTRIIDARGWPAVSLCSERSNAPGGSRTRFGIELPDRFTARVDEPFSRMLPLCPIWRGFAINTLFYAAILWVGWLLFAAPFALRRRLRGGRIKRGLCPACAYPVGESEVCTECGKPRTVKPKEMAA